MTRYTIVFREKYKINLGWISGVHHFCTYIQANDKGNVLLFVGVGNGDDHKNLKISYEMSVDGYLTVSLLIIFSISKVTKMRVAHFRRKTKVN